MKAIKISETDKIDLIEQFKDYLDKARTTDGQITFRKNLVHTADKQDRANIYISATAYLKMMLYVRDTSTEIAWHGTVTRYTDKNTYLIKDVFLYPQTLSGATVTTDQKEYNDWIEKLDDDTLNIMRFQGHSHVNFSTSPSGTDLNFYNDILQTLQKDDYYIFMILNKVGEMTFLIYDLEKNLIYENADIDVFIIENKNNTDLIGTIKESKTKYCKTHTYTHTDYKPYDYFDRYYDSFLGKDKLDTFPLSEPINSKYKNKTIKKGKTK